MTISVLIAAVNLVLAAVAGMVGLLACWKVFDLWREGECSERMWLILGIGIAWTGTSLNRFTATAIRGADETGRDGWAEWLRDSPLLLLFACMIMLGGITHLRSFTWEWPWPEWMRLPWNVVQKLLEEISRRLRRTAR
jgi:hypothetical protein